jgi:hypothetical protein
MHELSITEGIVDAVCEHAVGRCRVLAFQAGMLVLGEEAAETVRWRTPGGGSREAPQPGQHVALHWDWICDGLSAVEAETLLRCGASCRPSSSPRP